MAQITFTNTGGITSTGAIRGASVYSNNSPVLTGITKADVTGALGYTPATQDIVTTTKAGLVSATTGHANQALITDASGVPGWGSPFDFKANSASDDVDRYVYFAYNNTAYNSTAVTGITAGKAVISSNFKFNPASGNLSVTQMKINGAISISYNSTTEALEFNSV